MPTLENDRLVFRFPQIEEDASFSIDFQRTLRIPDTETTYDLPPGLGQFPVRHVEDFEATLPQQTILRGGAILPIGQTEAMWLNFSTAGPHYDLDFPVAIKVAAGKINAVTGDTRRSGLHKEPQDYMVAPDQPWLDGYAVEKGVIRQFVAMPLGEDYTVEEQVTGEAEWGGLQIAVTPLKSAAWTRIKADWEEEQLNTGVSLHLAICEKFCPQFMGLAGGGKMKQSIYPDPYDFDDWDVAATQRVYVTLVHSQDWQAITAEAPPLPPPTARSYSAANLPWFEYQGQSQESLPGSETLAAVQSVAELYEQKNGAKLPASEDVDTGSPVPIAEPKGNLGREVRTKAGSGL